MYPGYIQRGRIWPGYKTAGIQKKLFNNCFWIPAVLYPGHTPLFFSRDTLDHGYHKGPHQLPHQTAIYPRLEDPLFFSFILILSFLKYQVYIMTKLNWMRQKEKVNFLPLLLEGSKFYFFTDLVCACIGLNAQFALPKKEGGKERAFRPIRVQYILSSIHGGF